MSAIQNISIRAKLTLGLLLITLVTLALAGVVLFVYDLQLFRERMARNLTTLAQLIGDNSTAALGFDSRDNAMALLNTLRNEPTVVAARLYQKAPGREEFEPFATYVRDGAETALPAAPGAEGHVFEVDQLRLMHTIRQDGSQSVLGSLYLAADLTAISERQRVYAMEMIILFLLSAAFGTAWVAYLNRSIAAPLRQLADTAGQIADGKLAVEFPEVHRGDEVGLLSRVFQRMAETQCHQTRELVAGMDLLASSSAEISSSSSQLAASATEMATIVNETVNTVKEVKQTAEMARNRAQNVAESARSAADISTTGQQSTQDVLAAVERIRDQIDSIAERILHLSKQSQSIAEITGTVKDLAEQSNLLAVNAAIEAAHAGEQGQAFAVVAQEVKSLAEQSKEATTRVRNILAEVQKSISAVVMATERGSKEAEAGVRQAASAGDAIQHLSERIQTAADMGQQIAASSHEQSVGMDQVAAAMDNIKAATSGYAGSSRQVETISHQLHQLGLRIQKITDYYKF